ncbi:zinc finger, C2H2 type [Cooperia oncophora]
MRVTQENRKKERRKKRHDSDSPVWKNTRRSSSCDVLQSKYSEIAPSSSVDDVTTPGRMKGNKKSTSVNRSWPNSPIKGCPFEDPNCNDIGFGLAQNGQSRTQVVWSQVTQYHRRKGFPDNHHGRPPLRSRGTAQTSLGERTQELMQTSQMAQKKRKQIRRTLGHLTSRAQQRYGVVRLKEVSQPRRVLPKVGTKERKAILAEDAKRRTRDSANKYRCPHCTYSAPFPSKIKRHIHNKHSGSHSCSKCGKKFDEYSELRAHVAKEHPTVHRCQYCQFSNKILAEVRKHTVSNHEKGVACTVAGCNMRVARRRLRHHLQTMHPERIPSSCPRDVHSKVSLAEDDSCFTCSHCDFITNDLEDFNAHLMNVHERGILCPMPDCTLYILLGDLDNHLRSVHGECDGSPHEEIASGREFEETSCSSVPVSVTRRLASCTTASVSECVSTSNNSDDLPSDCDELDVPEKPSFGKLKGNGVGMQCALCGKYYRNPYLLKRHIRSVHDKAYSQYRRTRKNVCSWEGCEKAFTTPGLLEDHMNYHKGITPYRCNSCDMSFAARARFAVHLSKYHRMSIRDYTSMAAFRDNHYD